MNLSGPTPNRPDCLTLVRDLEKLAAAICEHYQQRMAARELAIERRDLNGAQDSDEAFYEALHEAESADVAALREIVTSLARKLTGAP